MKGIIYGVGVGPGDPELMTLKAVRLIRETNIIAVPGRNAADSVAYQIALKAVPELAKKETLAVYMPMVRDREEREREHRKGAQLLASYLDRGEDVVFLTLGDPTIYSTFSYLQHILEEQDYRTQLISGVPSFCAAAARLNISLAEWDEPVHILPAAHTGAELTDGRGNYVLMKSSRNVGAVRESLIQSGRRVWAVTDCGMESERIYQSAREIPEDAGYFSLIIAKGEGSRQI